MRAKKEIFLCITSCWGKFAGRVPLHFSPIVLSKTRILGLALFKEAEFEVEITVIGTYDLQYLSAGTSLRHHSVA